MKSNHKAMEPSIQLTPDELRALCREAAKAAVLEVYTAAATPWVRGDAAAAAYVGLGREKFRHWVMRWNVPVRREAGLNLYRRRDLDAGADRAMRGSRGKW